MREKKLKLEDFVQKDQFELNLYLTYLFNQVKTCKKKSKVNQLTFIV